ncbi:hypothetical protein [Petrotoga sp. 9PWA.NaAc.5.4]|uniref:hypothetical protein n=1 Tax=Petrotoga sp. 9PWA.NaAc.5.4 TaxID=1434328 RepID=UPI000CB5B444|nr:hypothetical protein [Petrotoga sp. 9PWA.NaAc.5.4]PNR97186.1 hypothetical protein X924_00190 [Petrotoga sp. 9PWA.NaAc.5.4]
MKNFLQIFLPFTLIVLLLGFSAQKSTSPTVKPSTPTAGIPVIIDKENLYEVTFLVVSVPDNTPSDLSLYMMGNFNDWLVGDEEYRFEKLEDGTYRLILEMPPNTQIEYKYNMGNYDYIEKNFLGKERENRRYKFEYNFDVVRDEIESW